MTSIDTTAALISDDLASIRRYAAFSDGDRGGNPAGVMIADDLPDDDKMQRLAASVGYSETVFAAREAGGTWRVRYFSPEAEVSFYGHATIAPGAALAESAGAGTFPLRLKDGQITVEAASDGTGTRVALQLPSTRSRPADEDLVAETLSILSMKNGDLDLRIPPKSRERLAAMAYNLERGRDLMVRWELGSICLVHAASDTTFTVRNAFASLPISGRAEISKVRRLSE